MTNSLLLFFGASLGFLSALFATPVFASLARRFGVLDRPETDPRKRHAKAIPLWGGLAIYAAFVAVVFAVRFLRLFPEGLVPWTSVYGLLLGGFVLMVGGALDDRYDLPPRLQIFFPVIAVSVAVLSGITIESVRSPFGGYIPLNFFTQDFGFFALNLPGDLLAFFWILGLTYTTKVLDGLDGLVAGIAVIACLLMLLVALRPELAQPDVALLAAIGAGAFGGFLVWNTSPAEVFLGETGSTFAGFLIGSLAVISGSKVATTLLVLGVPILDLVFVIFSRIKNHRGLAKADLSHLHFRLLQRGFSVRSAVIFLYLVAIGFGIVGLVGSTGAKALTLILLAAALVGFNRYLGSKK